MNISKKNIALLILSAGYSSRMGAFKPLLPYKNTTVIEHSINKFIQCGIHNIYIVTGYNSHLISKQLENYNVSLVYNDNYDKGMYSSIVEGVKNFPSNIDGFLMLPVDIANIKEKTIKNLIKIFNEHNYDIIYPSFNNRKGHPPLISSRLFKDIENYSGDGGLKKLLGNFQDNIYYYNSNDMGILFDIDTKEDYRKLIDT